MPILQTLATLLETLAQLAVQLLQLGFHWGLLLFWIAWWLWGVNWNKAWPALRQGAWAPLVLIMVVAAFVWSRILPTECDCLGFVSVPNFLWQLGAVALLAAVTFFCGWLQGQFGWAPAEINLDPPVSSHDDHGHGRGHH
jgi:hypothetical protein